VTVPEPFTKSTTRTSTERETYYDVLGIGRNADPEAVSVAYRLQALKWHPDRNKGSAEATERFKRIAEAYGVLSDPVARQQYDATVAPGAVVQPPEEVGLDAELAARIFMQEMAGLAVTLSSRNEPWRRIAAELVRRGCPEFVAREVARSAEQERKRAVRESASKLLAHAFGYFALGAVIGVVSAVFAPVILITVGFFVYGGWNMLQGVFFLVTGRAPTRSGTSERKRGCSAF